MDNLRDALIRIVLDWWAIIAMSGLAGFVAEWHGKNAHKLTARAIGGSMFLAIFVSVTAILLLDGMGLSSRFQIGLAAAFGFSSRFVLAGVSHIAQMFAQDPLGLVGTIINKIWRR